CQQHHSYPLTF
nr:immunoglobulin light chain junction region [Macaca mulatta]MOX52911.1 immunoglobulin light chain junction region [Macaca mulatta]MOX54313.1 immunoglobulin light chain junction region [Macaca mulatta]MOX54395.1 immunoglobulin light chain junction region [Macaca mulatta]MOX54400.1 immunoglobulin light chain junction region [Macaca mulatta]